MLQDQYLVGVACSLLKMTIHLTIGQGLSHLVLFKTFSKFF